MFLRQLSFAIALTLLTILTEAPSKVATAQTSQPRYASLGIEVTANRAVARLEPFSQHVVLSIVLTNNNDYRVQIILPEYESARIITNAGQSGVTDQVTGIDRGRSWTVIDPNNSITVTLDFTVARIDMGHKPGKICSIDFSMPLIVAYNKIGSGDVIRQQITIGLPNISVPCPP